MNACDKLVCGVLDILGIDYIVDIPQTSELAVDFSLLSSTNLEEVKKLLTDVEYEQLCLNLVLSWFFKTKPLTPFDWGRKETGEPLPFLVKGAFSNDSNAMNYTTVAYMLAQPANMCLVVKCENYIRACKHLHAKVKERLDDIFIFINSLNSMEDKVKAETVINNSFIELSFIVSQLK